MPDQTALLPAGPFSWVRRGLAAAIVVGGLLAIGTDRVHTCEQKQSVFGTVATVCHPPHLDDPLVVGGIVLALLLLLPDLAEFSVPGLVTLKLRLREQEARTEATTAELEAIRVQIAHLSASSSSDSSSVATQIVHLYPPAATGLQTATLAAELPEQAAESASSHLLASARLLTGETAMTALIDEASEDLGGPTLHVYMPNSAGLLLPVDEPERSPDDAGWPTGVGVVGQAWLTGQVESRRSPDLHRDSEQLPEHRRSWYTGLRVVTAIPVLNAAGRVIAVLSAASDDDAMPLDEQPAVERLILAASLVARVLVDLLGWETDAPVRHPDSGGGQ